METGITRATAKCEGNACTTLHLWGLLGFYHPVCKGKAKQQEKVPRPFLLGGRWADGNRTGHLAPKAGKVVAVSEMPLESTAQPHVPRAGAWAHSGLGIKSSNCPSAFGSSSGGLGFPSTPTWSPRHKVMLNFHWSALSLRSKMLRTLKARGHCLINWTVQLSSQMSGALTLHWVTCP